MDETEELTGERDATEVRPIATDAPKRQDPSLADVRRTLGGWLRSRGGREKDPQGARRTLVVLGIGAAIVLTIMAIFSLRAADKPTVDQASADLANLVSAPASSAGDYDPEDAPSLDAVNYVEVVRSDDDTCTATGTITYGCPSVSAEVTASIEYAPSEDGWEPVGTATTKKISWTALAGADQDKVVDAADILLQKADVAQGESTDEKGDEPSLLSLYRNASCTVARETFDPEAQTDTIVLRLQTDGAFATYSCDLTVELRFRSKAGSWELVSCAADDDARTPNLKPLLGTWEGTFVSQENDGHGCYGAREVPLKLEVAKAGIRADGSVRIEGELWGLAHFHGATKRDVTSAAGDQDLSENAFQGTLETTEYGYAATCSLPEAAGGTLELTLTLGTADDPAAATATLTTTHTDEGSFLLVPYEHTATFADTYTIEKAS